MLKIVSGKHKDIKIKILMGAFLMMGIKHSKTSANVYYSITSNAAMLSKELS